MTKHYEQRKEANKRYLSTLDSFALRMPGGMKAEIKAHAEQRGESLNGFVIRSIEETMQRDKAKEAQ